ncbi:CDGSH iron-sulfur domain-containing protein [Streptomyces sp. NPDC055055]
MSVLPEGNAPRAAARDAARPGTRRPGGTDDAPPGPAAGRRADPPRLRPLPEGPLLVEGPADILMPDGSVLRCERPVFALCTCRRTLRAPFCDTSHRPHLRHSRKAGGGSSRRAGPAQDAKDRATTAAESAGPTEEADPS